jgi:hypothetical protein
MRLQPVETVGNISRTDFHQKYFNTGKPVVIRDLAKSWPAYQKWTWDYFSQLVGSAKVGIYNNVKSDSRTPVNTADDYTTIGKYIEMISRGPAEWRIFLFNLFQHAPQLTQDFSWPEHLMNGFVKRYPMLFMGGKGSVTHMHYDIDMSHILHTQFAGRKRVLLFPHHEQHKLYRKPFEVLSLADFTNYYDPAKSRLDTWKFPAVKEARGYEVTLEHGDTLFMPAGYWHHMEYEESGFAMSLRAMQQSLTGKIKGAWSLAGMRTIDTVLKKTAPQPWYAWKERKVYERAAKALEHAGEESEGVTPVFNLFWGKE